MRKLEKLVHDAVDESDREILNQTEELGYFSLSLSQFRGKLGWVTWVIMIVQTLLFLAGVWCATQFFATNASRPRAPRHQARGTNAGRAAVGR